MTAFVWALGLVVAAFFVPVYTAETARASGVVSTTATLTEENGLAVLVPLALPAALTALVWIALHHKCSCASARSGEAAWWLIGLVGVFVLLTGFTVGVFFLPVALLLAGAAALTPSGRVLPRG